MLTYCFLFFFLFFFYFNYYFDSDIFDRPLTLKDITHFSLRHPKGNEIDADPHQTPQNVACDQCLH